MTDAYIYDAVRTPRGKGRKDGSLHEVTPVRLAVTALQALRDRNKLDTQLVDDVVLGCVMPIGEQGADIARTAAVHRGLRRDACRACRSTASAPRASKPPTWRRRRSCRARARPRSAAASRA